MKMFDLILDCYLYYLEKAFNNAWDEAEREQEWDLTFTKERKDWRYFYND